jgi:hypothetical protein
MVVISAVNVPEAEDSTNKHPSASCVAKQLKSSSALSLTRAGLEGLPVLPSKHGHEDGQEDRL